MSTGGTLSGELYPYCIPPVLRIPVQSEGEHFRRRVAGGCGRHPIERVAVAEDVGLAGVFMLAGPAREGG